MSAFPSEWILRKNFFFLWNLTVCACKLAVHSVLTLQDLIKCIYFWYYSCKHRHSLTALWSCCQQSFLARLSIMWIYTMGDLRHWLCKREERMGWGIMKDALEKGVKEAIFPRRPAENLERNASLLSRGTVNCSWHMTKIIGTAHAFLEGRRMLLKSRTSN